MIFSDSETDKIMSELLAHANGSMDILEKALLASYNTGQDEINVDDVKAEISRLLAPSRKVA